MNELVILPKLHSLTPEYKSMLATLDSALPAIHKSAENFNKTQSQFMDNMLTVSHPTPLRNVRQILAEMKKTEEALREAHVACLRRETEIEIKERDAADERDLLKRELLEIDVIDLRWKLEATQANMKGAIRKMTNYAEQYKAILKSLGKTEFTEADFEAEEERYHIMKAFDQGVTAARSRGGVIDEGNLIYLTQIGVNCAVAQRCVSGYLVFEEKKFKEGQEPSHEDYLNFLNVMADRFKGSAEKYAKHKGMDSITKLALIESKP